MEEDCRDERDVMDACVVALVAPDVIDCISVHCCIQYISAHAALTIQQGLLKMAYLAAENYRLLLLILWCCTEGVLILFTIYPLTAANALLYVNRCVLVLLPSVGLHNTVYKLEWGCDSCTLIRSLNLHCGLLFMCICVILCEHMCIQFV